MAANTIPTVSTLPPAPTRADAPADFTAKADTFVASLPGLVTQVNLTVKGMNDQASYLDQLKTDTIKATGDNAAAAANSATAAANQVTAATTQANNAQTYANQSKDYRDSSQSAAAAAQAAAGLPAISGKSDYMLSVNAAGNGVEYRVSVPRPTSAAAGYAVVVNPAGNGYTTQMIPVSPITKYYESASQSIVANGSFSVTHGLGLMPKMISAYLVCQTAFGGYAVGERVEWPIADQYGGTGNLQYCGGTATFDGTSIFVKFGLGGGPILIRKDSGAYFDAASYFRIVVRAMA